MESNTRNRADIFREQIEAAQNGGTRPNRDAGPSIGATSTSGGTNLTWMEDGVPKKWFKWGKSSFDSANDIFM